MNSEPTKTQEAGVRQREGIIWPEFMLWVLVMAYIAVSIIAYTDYPRENNDPPLARLEKRGLEIWRRENCQACHQIHGFGGFLGPDLTNRVDENTPDDAYRWIMDQGLGRMPAFHLSQDDHRAVMAYLRAINRTGPSLPPPLGSRVAVDPWDHLTIVARAWAEQSGGALRGEVRAGLEVWVVNRCGACHVPFAPGRHRAPDLSARAVDRSVETLTTVITQGRSRMPAFGLTGAEIHDLGTLLDWTSDHRAELVAVNDRLLEREEFSWTAVPWFEYADAEAQD